MDPMIMRESICSGSCSSAAEREKENETASLTVTDLLVVFCLWPLVYRKRDISIENPPEPDDGPQGCYQIG